MQTVLGTAQFQVAAGTTHLGRVRRGDARAAASITKHEPGPEWRTAISQKTGRNVVSSQLWPLIYPFVRLRRNIPEPAVDGQHPRARRAPRVYVTAAFTWLNNDPLDTVQPSLRTAWVTTKVGYYLTRWLSLEGFYEHTQQDSQRPGGQLERNQVGFQVVGATKPVKIR